MECVQGICGDYWEVLRACGLKERLETNWNDLESVYRFWIKVPERFQSLEKPRKWQSEMGMCSICRIDSIGTGKGVVNDVVNME